MRVARLSELVEANIFADVELDQDEHGAAQGSVRGLGGDEGGQGLGRDFAYRWGGDCEFAIHEPSLRFGIHRDDPEDETSIVPEVAEPGERAELACSYKPALNPAESVPSGPSPKKHSARCQGRQSQGSML